MGSVQSFDRIKVELHRGGTLKMGGYNQNRGTLHLVVDGGKLSIGNHCFFNTGSCVTCLDEVVIGDRCKFGNNLVIVDHDHNYRRASDSEPEFVSSPIRIGDDTWVGANVVILRGTTIGKHCVIGAGSVVKGEIPDNTVLVQKRETTTGV